MKHDAIAEYLPHAGRMCLLDEASAWDTQHIRCRSALPASEHHPLALRGRIGTAQLLEYAAQAAALHSALLARDEGAPPARGGVVAGVRDFVLLKPSLPDTHPVLDIEAECLARGAGGLIYRFRILADGDEACSGRLTIAAQP